MQFLLLLLGILNAAANGLLVCNLCGQKFGDYDATEYNLHIYLHNLKSSELENIPKMTPIERLKTISSERTEKANKFFFNPPNMKYQWKMRRFFKKLEARKHGPMMGWKPEYEAYKFKPLLKWRRRKGDGTNFRMEFVPFESTKYRPMPKGKGGIRPIVGDGHCLFRSISYALTGTEEYFQLVRELIADELEKDRRQPWVKANIKEFDLHLTKLRFSNQFGEIPEVIAAAKAFNVNMLIFWKELVVNKYGERGAGALLKKGQNERYLKTAKMSVSWRMIFFLL